MPAGFIASLFSLARLFPLLPSPINVDGNEDDIDCHPYCEKTDRGPFLLYRHCRFRLFDSCASAATGKNRTRNSSGEFRGVHGLQTCNKIQEKGIGFIFLMLLGISHVV
jgi:hypothetical protein